MSKLPYFPCYARDILSSTKIALMSGEAFKACWLLTCHSWLDDERATLANDEAKLQALARVDATAWARIRLEVLDYFKAGEKGRVFSPRLLEISDLHEKRSKAGSKGGSKTQAKRAAKPQASESESSSESEVETEPKTRYDQTTFDQFWSAYPRKVGKQKCREWFKSHKPDNLEQMLSTIEAFKKTDQWQDPKLVPHPITWLHRGGWEDEAPTDDRSLENEQEAIERHQQDKETERNAAPPAIMHEAIQTFLDRTNVKD